VAYNSKFTLTGNVQFNGESIHRAKLNKKIAVVAQDDTLFSFLTVRETLYLAAFFAGGEVVGKARTNLIVDAVMRELSLTAASETIVGSATRRGVSGGEYKRVLIGKELMKKPRTIFLDEPTSGLDSFQAFAVIESMKALATRNKIVVAVIHQPRSSIFGLFDLLLLLSAGKIMYFGPAAQAVQYFATMGYPCPEHFNPADFFLDLLSVNVKSAALEKESSHRIDALGRAWADPQNAAKPAPSTAPVEEPQPRRRTSTLEIINPEEARNYSGEVKDGEASDEGKDGEGDSDDECDEIIGSGKLDREAATGEIEAIPRESVFVSTRSDSGKSDPCRPVAKWFDAFGLLLWRALSEIFRNYGSLAIRAGTVLFYAMILSLIYQDLGYTQQNIQDRTGLLYFMLINQVSTALAMVKATKL
jgi:ABC-type multidrug transport system ATPase subunit